MVIVFRLAYALAVAIFFILVVIFGQRIVFSEPEFPPPVLAPSYDVYCTESGCYGNGTELDEADDTPRSGVVVQYVQTFRTYYDDGDEYSRNVFVVSVLLGMTAIAAGVYLFRRVEALALGLVLGGIGVVIYGWVESSWAEGKMGDTHAFIAAAIGFVVLAAGGYWFLGGRERGTSPSAPDPPPQSEG